MEPNTSAAIAAGCGVVGIAMLPRFTDYRYYCIDKCQSLVRGHYDTKIDHNRGMWIRFHRAYPLAEIRVDCGTGFTRPLGKEHFSWTGTELFIASGAPCVEISTLWRIEIKSVFENGRGLIITQVLR